MNPPIEEYLFNELVDMVRDDLRLRDQKFDISSQPGAFTLHIGGQYPIWEYRADKNRLKPENLPAYATEIVDEWDKQRVRPSR